MLFFQNISRCRGSSGDKKKSAVLPGMPLRHLLTYLTFMTLPKPSNCDFEIPITFQHSHRCGNCKHFLLVIIPVKRLDSPKKFLVVSTVYEDLSVVLH